MKSLYLLLAVVLVGCAHAPLKRYKKVDPVWESWKKYEVAPPQAWQDANCVHYFAPNGEPALQCYPQPYLVVEDEEDRIVSSEPLPRGDMEDRERRRILKAFANGELKMLPKPFTDKWCKRGVNSDGQETIDCGDED